MVYAYLFIATRKFGVYTKLKLDFSNLTLKSVHLESDSDSLNFLS
jgi:hypothetical protein